MSRMAMWTAGCLAVAAVAGAADADYATRMVGATIKVFQKDSTGTGFLVAPPKGSRIEGCVLVTARHILEKATGDEVLLVLRRARGDGTFERSDFPMRIRENGKPRWTSHPAEDCAAIAVTLPPNMAIDPIPFESLAVERDLLDLRLHVGTPALVLGYPTRFEANDAGFPVARQAGIASHPLTPVASNRTFLADFTTFAGDSGGPVFVADSRSGAESTRPLVIGMILAHYRHDEKVDTMFEERMIHHPLDLSRILHATHLREVVEAVGRPQLHPLGSAR